ncbi:alkaline phosphatase family protein [Dokdonia sp.]|uniref:alkaline phosphatase family protein n=1 Tax=Dokdonia sp. TaxID=2024995 RepID=UPI003264E606
MSKKKLLLIGWDAADWKIIGPLLAKGQMPALKKMIDNGVYGNMSTMNPPFSPMLWSSVATGKTADKHGVLGFIEIMPDLEGVRPVTTNSRKTRAIWNILHNKGYKSNLVGWWPSYPVEPINGVVISDKFQKVNIDPNKPSPLAKGTIHPKSAYDDFLDLRMFPYEITKEHILPFIPRANEINQEEEKTLTAFAQMMAQNVSVHNATTKLLRTTEWDFMGVYYDLIDHFCHTFMRFHPPLLPGVDKEKHDIYKEAVIGAYRFQDMMLGRTLDLIDDDTTVMVMSDHGYESGNKRILKENMPKVQAAPALEHREFGMFVAMGPNIKKNESVFGLNLLDITPTILHHFGLPVGEDMDGKVILEMFKEQKQPEFIKSWEDVEGDFGEIDKDEKPDALSDYEAMEQLIELGYIDRPDEKKEVAIHKVRCDLKHNLVTVHLGRKNYVEAKRLLLELIEEPDPIDIAPYYKDLVTISVTNKNYKEASEYLNKLKRTDTKIKYNLFFLEVDIHEGLGETRRALKILEDASEVRGHLGEIWYRIGTLKYKMSDYEPAKIAFEKAISIESDKAKYHRGMAEVMLSLKEYEEAVEYALTSIELVRNFPQAHFVLGQALEKLGDLENAKIAFEMASKLKPIIAQKDIKALENIEEKLETPIELRDKNTFKYRKDQIVVVSGLPRSGTSLMMQMLDKGGMPILTDNKRKADESNPKGYYELESVMSIHKDNSWLDQSKDKAVKVVGPLLKHLDPQFRYKIIFMKRDLFEIIKSQRKMIGKDPSVLPVKLMDSYKKLLENIENWKEKEPGVELVYIDYKETLSDPQTSLNKIEEFLGVDLDKEEMEKCIDVSLYRNRGKESK